MRQHKRITPFWTAYALTLTETVGAGILALPIAVAGVGPIPGIVVIVVLGCINMATVAAIAETATHNSRMRSGSGYFGELVQDLLGTFGSVTTSLALAILCFSALVAYYIGFSITLANATGIGQPFWVTALFCLGVYLVSRPTLKATVGFAVMVSAVNFALLTAVALLTVARVPLENLTFVAVPWLDSDADSSVLSLIFGTCLFAYFGHVSVGNCACTVLQRDRSGRSLLWGCVAAQASAMVLYAGWILAINGTIEPAALMAEKGTALVPIAVRVGPEIHVLGSLFVIFGMGMASVHFSLGLVKVTRERISASVPPSRINSSAHRLITAVTVSIAPYLPLTMAYILVMGMVLAKKASFVEPLSFGGAIAGSVFVGILPVLMLAASRRRRNDAPKATARAPGHPVLLGAVYTFFITALVLYGTVIWDAWQAQLAALVTAVLMIALTVSLARRGAFRRRPALDAGTHHTEIAQPM